MLRPDQIERHAKKLLDEVGTKSPPVPVKEIAEKLGVKVIFNPHDGDISGALHRNGELLVIGVNENDPEVRQRFTIAHEIGHLRLHDDPMHVDRWHYPDKLPSRTVSKALQSFLRNTESSQASDPREIEANRFAAALLIPVQFLARSFKSPRPPLKEIDVRSLAEEYQVSQQAMTFRLINLGIPVESA